MITRTLEEAEQELYYWQMTDGDNFTSKLFELICKADRNNTELLSLGFPNECLVAKGYQNIEGYWESIQEKYKK